MFTAILVSVLALPVAYLFTYTLISEVLTMMGSWSMLAPASSALCTLSAAFSKFSEMVSYSKGKAKVKSENNES